MCTSIIASRRPALRQQLLAKELAALQPDVILANSTPVTAALQREIRTIPIVFVGVTADPIGEGFVTSLARPGGNVTGLLLFETSVNGKWLAMLKEIAPRLARAALVVNPKTAPYYVLPPACSRGRGFVAWDRACAQSDREYRGRD
jgi:putative tryptophan/tyrosine transport system substrate-binding protein